MRARTASPPGSDRRFEGAVALVTGASGGIGRAISSSLAREGAAVVLGYWEDGESAERVRAEIAAAGGRASVVRADLRRPDAPRALMEAAEAQFGRVDVLVNNAGVGGRSQELARISVAEFDELIAINLRAPFLLTQLALPAMRERRFGRVLFISSVAGFAGGFIGPHYSASKAGLHGLTHSLAPDVAHFDVTVNSLAAARIDGTGIPQPQNLDAGVPVGRPGRTDEVAELAMAMLRNAYLTNKVISLDGGIHPR